MSIEMPPPPPPQAASQLPAMIQVPVNFVESMLKFYPIARPFLRMLGIKVPREVDKGITEYLNGSDPDGLQNLVRMAQTQTADPYNVQQGEIPEPRIGEPVLGNDLAYRAWELFNHGNGMSYRDIARLLTSEGFPCSHGTVGNYIAIVDREMEDEESSKTQRLKRGVLIGALIIVPSAVGLVLGHFFL